MKQILMRRRSFLRGAAACVVLPIIQQSGSRYTDGSMLDILIQKENLLILEHIVETEAALFGELLAEQYTTEEVQGIRSITELLQISPKGRLNFGGWIRPADLPSFLTEIRISVDRLLQAKTSDCAIHYSPNPQTTSARYVRQAGQSVIITPAYPKIALTGSLAHEYTHHAQKEVMGISLNRERVFAEGHARGVQKIITRHHAACSRNQAYIFHNTIVMNWEIKRAYNWLAKQLGKAPKQNLLLLGALPYQIEQSNKYLRSGVNEHDLGTALFQIYEHRYKSEQPTRNIYRDALHGVDVFI